MDIVSGDLFKIVKKGDVIAHGCNCFCTQNAGIALQMSHIYHTSNPRLFPWENKVFKGDISKLGNIEYNNVKDISVINAYTQYKPGPDARYPALIMCLTKINTLFKGRNLVLPLIGAGIGGLEESKVLAMFERHLLNTNLTVVKYVP